METKQEDDLVKRMDTHDKKDDERFTSLGDKIDKLGNGQVEIKTTLEVLLKPLVKKVDKHETLINYAVGALFIINIGLGIALAFHK